MKLGAAIGLIFSLLLHVLPAQAGTRSPGFVRGPQSQPTCPPGYRCAQQYPSEEEPSWAPMLTQPQQQSAPPPPQPQQQWAPSPPQQQQQWAQPPMPPQWSQQPMPGYGDCLQQIWTPYGYQWANVCY